MHGRARQLHEGHVAGHHRRLGLDGDAGDAKAAGPVAFVHVPTLCQLAVLAVLGQQDTEGRRVLQGPAHEAGVLHARTVVGEHAHAKGRHLAQRRQFLAAPALGDGAGHADVAARAGAEVEHLAHRARRVDGGLGVRHGDDGRIPAECGSACPRIHGLRLLAAGLAQVGGQVDETGGDDASVRIEHAGPGKHVEALTNGNDDVIAHGHVGPAAAGGVDHGAASDHNVALYCRVALCCRLSRQDRLPTRA